MLAPLLTALQSSIQHKCVGGFASQSSKALEYLRWTLAMRGAKLRSIFAHRSGSLNPTAHLVRDKGMKISAESSFSMNINRTTATTFGIAMLLVICLAAMGSAREILVDAAATSSTAPSAAGANVSGSAEKPFQTIAAAIKAARSGDTITIRKGVYCESVSLAVSGTSDTPTILRAAPGERVVLSGFVRVKDWKEEGGGLYTSMVDGSVSDLFVGLASQPVSRWPGRDLAMRNLREPNKDTLMFKDSAALDSAAMKEVAAAPKSVMAFLYVAAGNYFSTIPVKTLDLGARAISVENSRSFATLQGKTDRYQLVNHPSLIVAPGQWAFERIGKTQTRLYFRPKAPADLERVQCRLVGERGLIFVGAYSAGPVSNIRIEGLEICGSAGVGVAVTGVSNVVISRCLIHNNRRNGLALRRTDNCQILNNIVLANGYGVGVTSSRKTLVQNNEIAYNMVDGIDIAGNVTGKPNGEPETFDVTVRRNYFHHHLLLSHPDNFQTYRGVHRLTIEDNVLLWGGQGIMTEETDDVTMRNCMVAGTAAVAVILGHSNSNNWTIENVTVGLGGWGAFSFTGKDYRLR
ncbi:MAG: right-handed parallel beta-helix repeat-containing protein, partial [Candidatus Sumerlaeota bacterium]|nr:right-handed parallel beta-helix repeat-containing protein [Candidatus Sumerlaeota bacterium]